MLRFVATCTFVLATSTSYGFRPKTHAKPLTSAKIPIEDIVLRPAINDVEERLVRFGSDLALVKYDRYSNALRVISGNFQVTINEREGKKGAIAACQDFIVSHFDYFNTNSEDLVLVKDATLVSKNETFVKFKVKRDGILVWDSNIDCRFKFNRLIQVVNQSYAEAEIIPIESSNFNKQNILKELKVQNVKSEPVFRVQINANGNGYEMIQVEEKEVSDREGNLYKAQTVAGSGEIYELKDTKHFATLSAKSQIYPRWYNESLQYLPASHLSVKTSSGEIITDIRGESLGLESYSTPFVQTLKGPYVGVIDKTNSARIDESARADGSNWTINIAKTSTAKPWVDPKIAQTMAFYHVNRIKDIARRYISSDWLDAKLLTYTNLNQTCNAYWDGQTINFFKADSQCANSAMISDVIYHEFGHGLDDNTGGIDDGAFSEGYGDILSLALGGDNQLGVGFFVANHAPVRDLAIAKVYPDDVGEVHDEGQIIGSTFYDLYEALKALYDEPTARDLLANYAFKMIYTTRTYLDVYDALLVIDDDDGDLQNGTPHMCLINKAFAAHGLATAMESCKFVDVQKIDVSDSDGDQVIEPGEAANLDIWVHNFSLKPLHELTADVSLAEGSRFVTLTSEHLNWEDIGRKQSAKSLSPLTLSVDQNAKCGDSFVLNFDFASDSGKVRHQYPVRLGARVGPEVSAYASGLPMDIEDFSTTESTIEMKNATWGESALVKNIRLKFDIRHPYIGDIVVTLVSPNGTEAEVFAGSGSSDDVHFDHDVSQLFNDAPAQGIWKLKVRDRYRRDSGYLDSFELKLTPTTIICD